MSSQCCHLLSSPSAPDHQHKQSAGWAPSIKLSLNVTWTEFDISVSKFLSLQTFPFFYVNAFSLQKTVNKEKSLKNGLKKFGLRTKSFGIGIIRILGLVTEWTWKSDAATILLLTAMCEAILILSLVSSSFHSMVLSEPVMKRKVVSTTASSSGTITTSMCHHSDCDT